MRTILIIILIILLIGALPSWPYSTGWGYYPSGGLGLILLIVLILLLMGRISRPKSRTASTHLGGSSSSSQRRADHALLSETAPLYTAEVHMRSEQSFAS